MHLNENNDVLDLVDQLRSQGISHYVNLPQIVVCGEQSSGKSSVLEAISGLQFPRKDNLCTRFATEVILRRSETESTNASIVPANDRSEDDREKLMSFHRNDFRPEDLESLVEEARMAMGIDVDKRAFSDDVLRIELSGPCQPHLTLVDLPGLFSAGNKAQSESDAEAVKSLVLSYMRNPRSIILAVVSAKNDFANQIVTKYTRDVDEEGRRTLGIITKPDTLHAGSDSESSYLLLAKNEDVYFRLGWHVLRNRDFDTRTVSASERDTMERSFFARGAWNELDKKQVGVNALRPRLSRLLRQQILIELPNLIVDVQRGLDECARSLSHMGAARTNTEEQRLYLLRISQDFTFLVRSAVGGSYTDTFFGSATSGEGYRKRLRAVVQNKSIRFAKLMRERGHAKHIVDTVTKKQSQADPRLISKNDYITRVLLLMTRNRGTELPGTYSPLIVSDLFTEQSAPWQNLVHAYIIEIWDATQTTVKLILDHVSDANTATNLQQKAIQPALDKLKQGLEEAVATILEQSIKGHPITYNHYLTDNIQKLRAERQTALLSRKLDQFFGTDTASGRTLCENKSFDVKSLLATLTQSTIADMDRYACSEATDVMRAYYKVALKQCIDDIAHAIERTLLTQLSHLLSPQTTMTLTDATVNSIAAEPDDMQQERARVVRKKTSLTIAHTALRGLLPTTAINTHEAQSPMLSDESDSALEGSEIDDEELWSTSRKKSQRVLRHESRHSAEVVESPELESNSLLQTTTTEQAIADDWGGIPIRSLGPVSASVLGEALKKKSKKKSKTASSDQQVIEDVKW